MDNKNYLEEKPEKIVKKENMYVLGIDSGSTSINAVMLDEY